MRAQLAANQELSHGVAHAQGDARIALEAIQQLQQQVEAAEDLSALTAEKVRELEQQVSAATGRPFVLHISLPSPPQSSGSGEGVGAAIAEMNERLDVMTQAIKQQVAQAVDSSSSASPTSIDMTKVFMHEPAKADEFDRRSVLGKGRFGTVYRMRFLLDNKLYAVKQVVIEDVERAGVSMADVRREVERLEKLHHPHIIRYICCFEANQGRTFNVVTELADGGSLYEEVGRHHEEHELLAWLQQALDALACMHKSRVLHRDIKPENLMLMWIEGIKKKGERRRILKVIDLGLAVVASSSVARTHTKGVGTADYSSFEKAMGRPYDHRDDIWALGCVFAELLLQQRLSQLGGSFYNTDDCSVQLKKSILEQCGAAAKSSHGRQLVAAIEAMLRETKDRPGAEQVLELNKVMMPQLCTHQSFVRDD